MIKGSIQEEDITIVSIYAPNIGAPQYIRKTLTEIKGEIERNTIIVGDFNTPFTPMDRSSKQKINKETQVLNDTLNEMDLIDIFSTFHPNAEKYTFFSSAHGTFSRIDHILGHRSNLSKFKKTEIISSIFSDNNAMRLLLLLLLLLLLSSFSRVRLCNSTNRSTPGLPVHHQLPEFTQTHVHRVRDAIQPSHPLMSSLISATLT